MKKRTIKKIVHEDVVVEVSPLPPVSKKSKPKKAKADNDKLTFDEAVSLLGTHVSKRKKRVHTFISTMFALMGCDVDLTQIKKVLKAADDIRLAGPRMTAMGHGVAFWNEKGYWEFISTDKEKLAAIHKERKLDM